MREILFKGKRRDNGEWIEGQLAYFFDNRETPYIMPHCYFGTRELGEYDDKDEMIISDEVAFGGFISVQHETVCQFTGEVDKKGNKIFEGDWLNVSSGYSSYIQYENGSFLSIYSHPEDGEELVMEDITPSNCEIIGNIHDKSE